MADETINVDTEILSDPKPETNTEETQNESEEIIENETANDTVIDTDEVQNETVNESVTESNAEISEPKPEINTEDVQNENESENEELTENNNEFQQTYTDSSHPIESDSKENIDENEEFEQNQSVIDTENTEVDSKEKTDETAEIDPNANTQNESNQNAEIDQIPMDEQSESENENEMNDTQTISNTPDTDTLNESNIMNNVQNESIDDCSQNEIINSDDAVPETNVINDSNVTNDTQLQNETETDIINDEQNESIDDCSQNEMSDTDTVSQTQILNESNDNIDDCSQNEIAESDTNIMSASPNKSEEIIRNDTEETDFVNTTVTAMMQELNDEINIENETEESEINNDLWHSKTTDSHSQIIKSEKITKEIGIQTIILGTEIKLGSKTKKRIAKELGYFDLIANNASQTKQGSMSPVIAAKQMRSSSQKIAKIINEHKAQLKVIFDRYSNGLTNKIKLDGLTRMLKDRNILKKISLVPEITKAFHKSSFTKSAPDSLTFDEFLQCIIRLANDLLSRKKKSKYKTAESRVSLFLAKLHLRSFPKTEHSLTDIVYKDKNNKNSKNIASDISPNMNHINNAGQNMPLQYDYRLTEKQLDSEFDNYFNTGGFFSDAQSAQSQPSTQRSTNVHTPNTAQIQPKTVSKNSNLGPLSPTFNKPQKRVLSKNTHVHTKKEVRRNRKVKPSPLQQQRGKKRRVTSYQQLHNSNDMSHGHQTQQSMHRNKRMQQNNNHLQLQSPNRHYTQMDSSPMHSPLQNNVYYQQSQQQMMSPNAMYAHAGIPQEMMSPNHNIGNNNNYESYEYYGGGHSGQGYSDEYDRAERELTSQLNNLTTQEQQLVHNIHRRQQNQLNRAVRPRNNLYRRR